MSYSNLGKGLGLVLATLLVGVAKNADTVIKGAAKNADNVLPTLGRSAVRGAVRHPSWTREERSRNR